MKEVKKSEQIVYLNVSQNSLTPNGAKKIFKSLLKNCSVISLDIGNAENIQKNKIGSKGVKKLNTLLA